MLSSNLFTLTALALAATAAPLSKRAQYSGRATFYAVGTGNCGWQSSSGEHVVALNTAQYGSTSQVSQYCGKTITISYNGNSQQATIVDSCPTCSYGDLDLSTSLFSALTGGNMGMGQMQVDWSFGSSTSSKPSSDSSKKNKSSNNNNDNSKDTYNSSPTTTTAAPSQTATTTTSTSIPTNTATKLQTGVPQWWKVIGNDGCPDVVLPPGIDPVSVAPSGNAEVDTLPAACGKWVQITNPAMNKTTVAMLTNYNLGGARNGLYLGDAYLKLANMTTGIYPAVIPNVTWGFLN